MSREYNTKQKEQILEYIKDNREKHVTADNIIKHFKNLHIPVSKTTVYRYLDKLLEQDIIKKYIIEDGVSSCYQYNDGGDECKEHFHFKCNSCNKLFHVSCEMVSSIKEHVYLDHGFKIDSKKTVFYGICEECAKKEKASLDDKNET